MTTTAPARHPVWRKATTDGYVTTADTARLIRDALGAKFPGVKFYVRSHMYAGGSSIHVYYDGLDHYAPMTHCYCTDGPDPDLPHSPNYCRRCGYMARLDPVYKDGAPAKSAVDAVAATYAGGRFDGMIDMAYSVKSWLNPDGSATYGSSSGTTGSMGVDPAYSNPRPDPGAVMVRFGADYVFVDDTLPYDVARKRGAA
jgi:hypothetical protein